MRTQRYRVNSGKKVNERSKKNKERENQKKTTNGTKMRRTDERIIVTTQSMQYILLMPI